MKAFAVSLRGAFPDWYATTDEMVAEEKRVAERWTGRGTHRGKFQGIAPTGRQVTVPGTVFYRFASGKITEFHGQFDGFTLMQQLGVIEPFACSGVYVNFLGQEEQQGQTEQAETG